MRAALAYRWCGIAAVVGGASVGWTDAQAAIVIPVAADARVIDGDTNDDVNFGSEATVRVRDRNSDGLREKAYLSFDLSSVNITAAEFVSATLSYKLVAVNNSPPNQPYLHFGVADNNVWNPSTLSETSITWNNAPNNAGGTQFLNEGTGASNAVRLLDSRTYQSVDAGEIKVIDVSEFINWALGFDPSYSTLASSAASEIATFLIRHDQDGTNSNNMSFHSKQAASGEYVPTLTIETQVIPEPASASLVAGGAGLMAVRRRRRA